MIVAMVAPSGRRSSASTRACFEFARLVWSPLRAGFGRTLDEDRALAVRPRLRLDMQTLLSIVPAQHRAATTQTVRGYLGIEPLGVNDVWRRLPDGAYNELDPTVTAGHVLRDAGPAHPPELTAFQSQSRSLRIVNATGVAPSPRRSSYPTIA